MNTFGTTLHSSTDEDLLCVPGICLGFHPTESCVVLGISENHVEFCARADLGWLDEGGVVLAEQVDAAARALKSSSFVVLGYTENPGEHRERLVRFASKIKGRVTDVLAMLALICWYDNQGAQQAECLEQLEKLAPQHRLLPLLQGLRALAIKPPASFPPF